MTLVEEIITVSKAYGTARGISLGRVSMLAFGDGNLLKRLESGSDLTTRRLEGAMRWFSANWPENGEWPDDVPRPAPEPEGAAA